jgi:DNA-binding GntR family transcriptional regulator
MEAAMRSGGVKRLDATTAGRRDADTLRIVISDLERDIVLGRLHPRERLIEDDLMRRFSVKRHVIRQALADLEQMGVVERVPNRGAMVRVYEAADIQQLYVVRDMLETQAAKLVPMATAKTGLPDLRRIQSIHDSAVATGNLDLVFRANVEFHERLFEMTGNPYLADAIKQFALRTHGIRFYCLTYPGYLEQSRREHWLMIEAIEAGDTSSLVKLCGQHLLASRLCYERAIGLRGAEA